MLSGGREMAFYFPSMLCHHSSLDAKALKEKLRGLGSSIYFDSEQIKRHQSKGGFKFLLYFRGWHP